MMLCFQLVVADYALPGSLERALLFHAATLVSLDLDTTDYESLLQQCLTRLERGGYQVHRDDTTWSVWSSR